VDDDYSPASWRLIRSAPADGATNMAVDEAILRAVVNGQVLPTLRLYAWEPPCLSLGRSQKVTDVDLDALRGAGYGLVRRPTGGKAILHVDELTYSVIVPQGDPRMAGGIVGSYRRLSMALVRGLERLSVIGIVADRRAENGPLEGPVCFEVPSDYEITVGGRKLVGSAQMRSQGVVLQHGTLPLWGDITRICSLLVARPDPAKVRARATTVERALGGAGPTQSERPVTWEQAAGALVEGFREVLNLDLEPGALTPQELDWADELKAGRYTTREWTHNV
jgi:lipoate-protein ligase A